jgi:hypothetical protein
MNAETRQDTSLRPPVPRNCAPVVFDDDTPPLYRDALVALTRARVPFLIGGAVALSRYTTVERSIKDLDLFVTPFHCQPALDVLEAIGCQTDWPYRHWLAKATRDSALIDVIYNSGNGVAVVDDEWLTHAGEEEVCGVPVKICPAEELLWSKSFVMERERYDGADVLHIIHGHGPHLDWARVLERFGDHWRVLLSHLVMYAFVYPAERSRIPSWVTTGLTRRLKAEGWEDDRSLGKTCLGTLVSRQQYLPDIRCDGYEDGRLVEGRMTAGEIADWTAAIEEG